MNLLASAATMGAPAFWTVRHFRSAAVTNWTPPTLPGQRTGPLYARTGGAGDRTILLLHGLVSSGDVFGAAYDQLAATHRVVIPDLLGFGRSMDQTRTEFPVGDHLDALDELASVLGLFRSRLTIGAHSMGAALALRWAAGHRDRVDRVVCWGAPIYSSPETTRKRISGTTMTRLFVLDTQWAERACAVSCRHRAAAGWLSAAVEPTLPIPIARAVSLHTWPAYRDAMRELVIDTDWTDLLTRLENNGTSVELVWGTHDKVGDPGYAREVAARSRHATVTLIEGADHHLPMSRPAVCLAQLRDQ